MAWMVPSIAKKIVELAPKYKRIVEPFGDGGSLAFYKEKRRAKEHIVNIEDEVLFALVTFIQGYKPTDKKRLKSFDWIASQETFDSVLAITATEGAELFYRFFYLKHFGVKAKDPDTPPTFDWLKLGEDAKSAMDIPKETKRLLRQVTFLNEDPIGVISKGGGDTFLVLLPKKPEHIDAVETKVSGLGGNFFFAKKSKSNDDLLASVAKNKNLAVSTLNASTIMVGIMEVKTNYDSKKIVPLDIQAIGAQPGGKTKTKHFNLNPDGRNQEWHTQTQMLEAFEQRVGKQVFKLLHTQAQKSGTAFETDGREGVDISLKTHAAELEGLLRAQYVTVMNSFGGRILDAFKGAADAPESKDTIDFFTSLLNKWINTFTAKKVVAIAKTTRKLIQEAIFKGEAAEESIRQIGARIVKDTGGEIARNRARTIAITETHSAAMGANDMAAEATGVEFKRRWLSARNANVRPSHAAADGQLRAKDEPFDVGGAKLMRPGDPSGPADETINCRCIVDYITEGF